MKLQNTIEFIISDLSELNSILKKNNIDSKVDINSEIREKSTKVSKLVYSSCLKIKL